jgi:hypothetical protein
MKTAPQAWAMRQRRHHHMQLAARQAAQPHARARVHGRAGGGGHHRSHGGLQALVVCVLRGMQAIAFMDAQQPAGLGQ